MTYQDIVNGSKVGVQAAVLSPTNKTGQVTVSSAATAVQLSATSVPCKAVLIRPAHTNTAGSKMYIGYAANKSGNAIPETNCTCLVSGTDYDCYFKCDDLNEIWVDTNTSGQKVSYRIV